MKFLNLYHFILIIVEVNTKIYYNDLQNNEPAPRGFGQYYIHLRHLATCDPEDPNNPANENYYNFIVTNANSSKMTVSGFITFPFKIPLDQVTFTPMVERNGKKSYPFNRTSNSPCTDVLMIIPLKSVLKFDNDCNIEKGHYLMRNFSPQQWIHKVFKGQISYERIYVTIEYYSWGSKSFCIYSIVDIRPIPKNNNKNHRKTTKSSYSKTKKLAQKRK